MTCMLLQIYEDDSNEMLFQANLYMTGDMLATFMAWLADVPAGGATGYDYPTKEMLVEPSRGAAALWMDLRANGKRESV